LAQVYDPFDHDRNDLEVYVDLTAELRARSVLDIGCGTGTFACLLAARGVEVVGIDPAEASLTVARAKHDGDRVTWLLGDATDLPPLGVDLAVMTGNVAQVFVTDDEWSTMLRCVRRALAPAGHLVFEVRDPRREAWRSWNRQASYERLDIAGLGPVERWVELTDVSGPLVSFRWTYHFERSGDTITSDSTLRFRDREEIEASLDQAGFLTSEVRDAPDRPGLELVFVAQPTG
jgi:SAM-dependent methyltransferase